MPSRTLSAKMQKEIASIYYEGTTASQLIALRLGLKKALVDKELAKLRKRENTPNEDSTPSKKGKAKARKKVGKTADVKSSDQPAESTSKKPKVVKAQTKEEPQKAPLPEEVEPNTSAESPQKASEVQPETVQSDRLAIVQTHPAPESKKEPEAIVKRDAGSIQSAFYGSSSNQGEDKRQNAQRETISTLTLSKKRGGKEVKVERRSLRPSRPVDGIRSNSTSKSSGNTGSRSSLLAEAEAMFKKPANEQSTHSSPEVQRAENAFKTGQVRIKSSEKQLLEASQLTVENFRSWRMNESRHSRQLTIDAIRLVREALQEISNQLRITT